MKKVILSLALISVVGCASPKQNVRFALPSTKSEEAWQRAQSHISSNSPTKLTIANDKILQTETPKGAQTGFTVTRIASGDSVMIEIIPLTGSGWTQGRANERAIELEKIMRSE